MRPSAADRVPTARRSARALVQRIKCRPALGRGGHQNPAALRPRPAPATGAAPAQCAPEAPAAAARAVFCRAAGSTNPPGDAAYASPILLLPLLRMRPITDIPRPLQASRVTRTANRVSTTSNSLHASCTSPAASGTSSPWLHLRLDQLPRRQSQQMAHPKSRTGTATSSSTGNRATGPRTAGSASSRVGAAQEPAPARASAPTPEPSSLRRLRPFLARLAPGCPGRLSSAPVRPSSAQFARPVPAVDALWP